MLCQSTRADYYCSGPDHQVNDSENVLLSSCLLTHYLNDDLSGPGAIVEIYENYLLPGA